MNEEQVRQHWFSLVPQEKQATSGLLWNEIVQAYTQPHRHYHTLHHVAQLLSCYHQFAPLIRKKEVVLFALFYHDFVYEPGQMDNEEKSADKAAGVLHSLLYPKEMIRDVRSFILATKNHGAVQSGDDDLNLFLDFDLSVLGAPWDIYEQYRQNIRREYTIYADKTFYHKRCVFLQQYLQSASLFKTKQFHGLEATARENLAKEAAQHCG